MRKAHVKIEDDGDLTFSCTDNHNPEPVCFFYIPADNVDEFLEKMHSKIMDHTDSPVKARRFEMETSIKELV